MNNITEYSDIFDDENDEDDEDDEDDEEQYEEEQDGRAKNLNSWKHFIF